MLREVEAGRERFDRDTLGGAGRRPTCSASACPTSVGGSGYGIVEQCLVLEQVGRTRRAGAGRWPSIVLGAVPIADVRHRRAAASAGPRRRPRARSILTAALAEPATATRSDRPRRRRADGDGWRLDGVKTCVPAGTIADAIVVPGIAADGDVGVVPRRAGAAGRHDRAPASSTNRTPRPGSRSTASRRRRRRAGRLDAAPTSLALDRRAGHASACARSSSACSSRALEMTAEYTKERVQFDRPIATFQAVGQRAGRRLHRRRGRAPHAVAGRVAAARSAARVDTEVEVAKFWAADAAHRVAHAAVHVHGGTGIDVDYPLHRYFVAAKALEFALGGATDQLLAIGKTFAATPE